MVGNVTGSKKRSYSSAVAILVSIMFICSGVFATAGERHATAGFSAHSIKPAAAGRLAHPPTTGSLKGVICPEGAADAGAMWKIDGGDWFESGAIEDGLAPGEYEVIFSEVESWEKPGNQVVEVTAGETTTVTGTYAYVGGETGHLRIYIEPAGAGEAGARWRIDGSEWYESGYMHDWLPVGEYEVYFKDIEGWEKPANMVVEVTNGETTTATGAYTALEEETGCLQVYIEPHGAAEAGAKWKIDGSDWFGSGVVHDGLAPGEYEVIFKDIWRWDKPANIVVEVTAGETATATGVYYEQPTGHLQVFIEPEGAVEAGAMWRKSTGSWHESGYIYDWLPVGEYEILFKDVEGWDRPANVVVEITAGETTTVTGTYTRTEEETGNLCVYLKPHGAREAGAMWRVDGSEWFESGVIHDGLAPGEYEVFLKAVEGWDEPGDVVAEVRAGETTTIYVEYEQRPGDLPQIHYFTAAPDMIGAGSSALLEWCVENADSISIDHGVGEVNPEEGERKVWPEETTTYTLTATNGAGAVTATATVEVGNEPEIHWFTSSNPPENPITVGQSAVLGWCVSGADRCEISWEDPSAPCREGVEPEKGTMEVWPTKHTKYTFTAVNEVGEVTATAIVAVTSKPTVISFTACPPNILPGQTTKLSWNVFGDAVIEISPDIGIVDGNEGSIEVTLDKSQVFVLTASNSSGKVTADVKVKVVNEPADLSASIKSSPNSAPAARLGQVGAEASFRVQVRNEGPGVARQFKVMLLEKKSIVDEVILDKLKAGQKKMVTLNYVPLRKGQRKLTVVADADNSIPEFDERDNRDAVRYSVKPTKGPDLLITDVKIEHAPGGAPRDALQVSFSIVNVGSKRATAFQYRVFLQHFVGEEIKANDVLVADGYVDKLAPGKRIDVSRVVMMKVFWREFYFHGIVDVHNSVTEFAEDNDVSVVKFSKDDITY